MNFFVFLINFLIILHFFLQGDPWGKDADLCSPIANPVHSEDSIAGKMIKFHQNVLSSTDGPRSHYFPSSSQYTLDSMRKYGFFQGYLLGCDRLLRENSDPWVYRTVIGPEGYVLKQDPVR